MNVVTSQDLPEAQTEFNMHVHGCDMCNLLDLCITGSRLDDKVSELSGLVLLAKSRELERAKESYK